MAARRGATTPQHERFEANGLLERLREHEQELDRRLEEARARASATLAEAREEAERLREDARRAHVEEVERRQQEWAGELNAALESTRREIDLKVAALARNATAGWERALALVVDRVTGAAS